MEVSTIRLIVIVTIAGWSLRGLIVLAALAALAAISAAFGFVVYGLYQAAKSVASWLKRR